MRKEQLATLQSIQSKFFGFKNTQCSYTQIDHESKMPSVNFCFRTFSLFIPEHIDWLISFFRARESVTSTLSAYTTFEPSKQEQIRREIGATNHNNVQNILNHLMAQNFQLSAPEQNIKNGNYYL